MGSGASGFKLTILTDIIMEVCIADDLSIFLPYPVIMAFLSSWAKVDIFGLIILKLISTQGLVFGSIGMGLFGDVNGNPVFCTFL